MNRPLCTVLIAAFPFVTQCPAAGSMRSSNNTNIYIQSCPPLHPRRIDKVRCGQHPLRCSPFRCFKRANRFAALCAVMEFEVVMRLTKARAKNPPPASSSAAAAARRAGGTQSQAKSILADKGAQLLQLGPNVNC